MNNYGCMLEDGEGIAINMSEACRYYKMSADGKNEYGMYNYARMIRYGRGTAVDKERALIYYQKAADSGHSGAKKAVEEMNSICLIQ